MNSVITRVVKVVRHASVQVLIQVVGFLTGIVLIRSMSKYEYGAYGIVISITSAVSIVAEGGINSAVWSHGARLRGHGWALGRLFASAMQFRYLVGLPVAVPGALLVWTLVRQNNVGPLESLLACVLSFATLWLTLTNGTYSTVHRLEYAYVTIRRVTLIVAVVRLFLIAGLFALSAVNLIVALSIGVLAGAWNNIWLRRKLFQLVPKAPPDVPLYRKDFLQSVLRTMPMSLLMVSSEQLILVILSFFGTTDRIAEVTALGRFGLVYWVATMVVVDMGAPLVAHTRPSRAVVRRILQVLTVYLLFCVAVVSAVAVGGDVLLLLLGRDYAGLKVPLTIIMCGAGLQALSHSFSALNQTKAWLKGSWLYIPLVALWAVLCIALLDLHEIDQVAIFVATQPIPHFVTQIYRAVNGANELRRAERCAALPLKIGPRHMADRSTGRRFRRG